MKVILKIRKLICTCMAFLTFAMTICPVSATEVNNNVDLSQYEQYTIDFVKARTVGEVVRAERIDKAIAYVKSLELSTSGNSHIEEACLNELESYRENGIELESYTVLVPKTRAATYYGTYNKRDYYYGLTSVSDFRRETQGVKKSSSTTTKWEQWISGAINVVLCFVNNKYVTVPYTVVSSITGVTGTSAVHNNSYNEYVEQFSNVVTRTIWGEETNGNLAECYSDQTCNLSVKLYFCPVGSGFSSDYIYIKGWSYTNLSTNTLSQSSILQICNTYFNKNSKVMYRFSSLPLKETWG